VISACSGGTIAPSPTPTTSPAPPVVTTSPPSTTSRATTAPPTSAPPPLATATTTTAVAGCPAGANCALVRDAIAKIDQNRLNDHMRALTAVGSRDPRHPGHAKAVAYIKEQLEAQAYRGWKIESHRTSYQGIPLENIFATIGSDHGGRVIIAAHYDSIANRTPGWKPATDPAPGADDNATGTAALLEFARVISTYDRLAWYNPITLAFFDGEELFYKGSAAYVQTLAKPAPIAAVVNIDMVGFNPIADRLDLLWHTNASAALRDRVIAVNQRYGIGVSPLNAQAAPDGSTIMDGTPFGLAGIPSVSLCQRYGEVDATFPGNATFHTVNDTPDRITNPRLWLKAAKLTLAVALEMVANPN
jgi:Zn-dependent M28 family amino/carboxypeptidase